MESLFSCIDDFVNASWSLVYSEWSASCLVDTPKYVFYKSLFRIFHAILSILAIGQLVNGSSCDGIDMVIKDLDLEPKVDAMMKEFLDPSRWEELSKETSSKILLCGDGSCWKTFKTIASLIAKGKIEINTGAFFPCFNRQGQQLDGVGSKRLLLLILLPCHTCDAMCKYFLGSGYHQKDRKPSQNDKTEHGMEKTVQNQGQSPKMPKSESILKNTIECNLNPSDGPGKPNSIFMKTVKTKWALNQLQQPICVQLTKTVKTKWALNQLQQPICVQLTKTVKTLKAQS
ncbi:hypothetical protein Tco_0538487 [Tanacetum coccineum]